MIASKNFHKNSSKKKSKSHHNNDDSDEDFKEEFSQLETKIFPLIKKIISSGRSMLTKNHGLIQCPLYHCNCKFYVSNDDLFDSTIVVCPQGHNICAEVYNIVFRFI